MREQNGVRRLLSGALLIIIVIEWMRPLSELSKWTDVYVIDPILFTIIGVLAVDVLRISSFWTWAVKSLIILTSVAAMFHGTTLLHLDWWISFTTLIIQDFLRLLTGQWDAISAEGRTLLFIGAWTTVVCWLYVVILYQRIALYITMVTIVYLLILQLWMDLDTTKEVIVVVIVGLALHGLSVLPVLENKFGLRIKHTGWPLSWIISSVLLICVTLGSGLVVSSGQDRAALHVSNMKLMKWESIETFNLFSMKNFPGYANKKADNTQKSGYSMTDTALGGAVNLDDSIAFLANTEQPDAYWRGESKAVYDGKGWSDLPNELFGYEIGDQLPDVLSDSSDHSAMSNVSSSFVQEVFPFPDYPQDDSSTILLSGGAIRRVDGVTVKEGASSKVGPVALDRVEGKYILHDSGTVTTYRIESAVPITSDSTEKLVASKQPIPSVISTAYVQLPEQLPARINQLTRNITDEFSTTWEKANAIEQFLGKNYEYTLTPKLSSDKGDFVDQFLFEQQMGYCDYFSTAMTVMLRTIGIPARWVKGFTPGEIINAEENGILQESALRLRSSQIITSPVIVRNRNAHSWVEVYILGIGWTAFDPTPESFINRSQNSVAALSTPTVEDEAAHPVAHKLVSGILRVWQDKRMLSSLLWIAAVVVAGQMTRIVLRSRLIRRWRLAILIRFLLLKYAWGITSNNADTRLLERVLSHTLSQYGHEVCWGETLRESVERGYYPEEVVVPLLELISLYELARYGPDHRKRIPYHTLEASWRLLR